MYYILFNGLGNEFEISIFFNFFNSVMYMHNKDLKDTYTHLKKIYRGLKLLDNINKVTRPTTSLMSTTSYLQVTPKEYLSESIYCDWKISFHTPKPTQNYRIISVVFFLLKNAKSINKYTEGLTNIIKSFVRILPGFRLRIYYDNTSENEINKILQSVSDVNIINSIELFEYNIPILKEGDHHKGFIGTLFRFLPFYNYEIHMVDECIVFDIDNILSEQYYKLVQFYNNNNIDMAYRSRPNYIYLRINNLSPNGIKYPIIASYIYQKNVIDKSVMSDFLEKMFINDDPDMLKLVNMSGIGDRYSYGIDEIYINKFHLMYMHNTHKKLAIVLFNHYNFSRVLRRYFTYLNDDQTNTYFLFLQELLLFWNIKINKKDDIIIWNYNDKQYEHTLDIFGKDEATAIILDKLHKQMSYNKKKEFTRYVMRLYKKYNTLPRFYIVIRPIIMGTQYDFRKINVIVVKDSYKINHRDIFTVNSNESWKTIKY
jgi:hypothetical protein